MSRNYVILPCNGLDKCAGCMTKEIALKLTEKSDSDIICPVFYRVAEARYNRLAEEKPLLVLDGCATRCASKLASEKGLKIVNKLNITDEAKNRNIQLINVLRLEETEIDLCDILVDELLQEEKKESNQSNDIFPKTYEYEIHKKDKFIFRVPKSGFYFNENDCWAYVVGNVARIGVTDFVQQSLSDIMFFTPPAVGAEIEQFEEVGNVESGKAVFEVVSPVSGVVKAVNTELLQKPELINQNPYEKGWIAEIELSNFEEDKDLLIEWEDYMEKLKRKVEEFHV